MTIETTSHTGVLQGKGALAINNGSLELANSLEVSEFGSLTLRGGTLTGAGTLVLTGSLTWHAGGVMAGTGKTVVGSGATGTVEVCSGCQLPLLTQRTLVNEGMLTLRGFTETLMSEGARFENEGTLKVNAAVAFSINVAEGSKVSPLIVNAGILQRTEGEFTTRIVPRFENEGTILSPVGHIEVLNPIVIERSTHWGGAENPSAPGHPHSTCGDPVDCATGNYSETQTDLAVGGRGVGLDLTRTYNSQAGAGLVVSQTDGNKHETKYVRNVIGEVTEVVDPLGRKTIKVYDKAGNLTSLTDPAKRTTTYKYDPANRLKEITYSDGITPTVKYEYAEDGDRTSMTDGTGTTTYGYDQLDRLTESKDGHGDTTGYEYNLANEQTKITYPNTKAVERAYDKAGRLEKVTDWLEHTTKFVYDPDFDLTATAFPSGTGEEDKYVYSEADQMSETAMKKGAETLASLVYKRDNVGQLTKTTSTGLPGAEVTGYAYDENDRLTEAGANAYEYDAANNPIKTPGSTNVYDEADELEKGTSVTYSTMNSVSAPKPAHRAVPRPATPTTRPGTSRRSNVPKKAKRLRSKTPMVTMATACARRRPARERRAILRGT